MNRFNNLQDIGSNKGNSYEARNFISIQDYTGEGFQLYDSSEKINEIAAEHEDEMIDAIKAFFLNSYSIHIKIHNMVSGNDSVTVFVESRNEPSFHTFVIVPVDEKHRKVKTDSIWSPDGEVERAIKGGLYAMAFGEEFSKLDDYLEGIMEMFPVIGTPKKVIDMVKANGYMTPYYFLSPSGNDFKMLFNEYVNNPHMSKIDIQSFIYKNMPEPRNINIGIEVYMKEKEAAPEQIILDTIVMDIKKMTGIPRGAYSIYLNDNLIDKKRGIGKKDSTLEPFPPNKIIKV